MRAGGVQLGGGVGSHGMPAMLERKFSMDRHPDCERKDGNFDLYVTSLLPEDTGLCPVTLCQAQSPDQQHQLDFGTC